MKAILITAGILLVIFGIIAPSYWVCTLVNGWKPDHWPLLFCVAVWGLTGLIGLIFFLFGIVELYDKESMQARQLAAEEKFQQEQRQAQTIKDVMKSKHPFNDFEALLLLRKVYHDLDLESFKYLYGLYKDKNL